MNSHEIWGRSKSGTDKAVNNSIEWMYCKLEEVLYSIAVVPLKGLE